MKCKFYISIVEKRLFYKIKCILAQQYSSERIIIIRIQNQNRFSLTFTKRILYESVSKTSTRQRRPYRNSISLFVLEKDGALMARLISMKQCCDSIQSCFYQNVTSTSFLYRFLDSVQTEKGLVLLELHGSYNLLVFK